MDKLNIPLLKYNEYNVNFISILMLIFMFIIMICNFFILKIIKNTPNYKIVNKLQNENNDLKNKNRNLELDNENVTNINHDLSQTNEQIRSENENLKQEKETVNSEKLNLLSECDKYKKLEKRLTKERQKLMREKSVLEKDIELLNEKINILMIHDDEIKSNISSESDDNNESESDEEKIDQSVINESNYLKRITEHNLLYVIGKMDDIFDFGTLVPECRAELEIPDYYQDDKVKYYIKSELEKVVEKKKINKKQKRKGCRYKYHKLNNIEYPQNKIY